MMSTTILQTYKNRPFRILSTQLSRFRFGTASSNDTTANSIHSTGSDAYAVYKEQMEDLQAEREALFMFSDEEKLSWTNHSVTEGNSKSNNSNNSSSSEVQYRSLEDTLTHLRSLGSNEFSMNEEDDSYMVSPSSPFTHLSSSGDSISMVDVGNKIATTRMAKAQCKVIFPSEVMAAFDIRNNGEMVGPKGPIFETARLAGIMGAKRTSDLIPLCHPLPLDRVHVDIRLEGNVAIIKCECKVTHRTGVEVSVSHHI